MEVDPETKGNGNSYTTEFRQYDPRLGRWLSLDPLMMMFPSMSPYCAFDNNPIYYTDPYGLSADGPGDPPAGLPSNPIDGQVAKADNGNSYLFLDGKWGVTYGEEVGITIDRCYAILTNNVNEILSDVYNYLPPTTTAVTGQYKLNVITQLTDAFLDYRECKGPDPTPPPTSQVDFGLHDFLDVMGMIPGVGEIFDAANALLYAAEGDYTNALISTSAMVPILGNVGPATRLGKKAVSEVIQEAEQQSFKQVSEGIIYRRTNPKTGEKYIGKSKSDERFLKRQGEHNREHGIKHDYDEIGRATPGPELDKLEEDWIRREGGPSKKGGKLQNKRYEMSEKRYRKAGGTVNKPTP